MLPLVTANYVLGGPPSLFLREASMTVIASSTCSRMYNDTDRQHLSHGIDKTQLCAGNPQGGIDSCQVNTETHNVHALASPNFSCFI